jgi:hypothetical protein
VVALLAEGLMQKFKLIHATSSHNSNDARMPSSC